jgi:hypothetical protein
MGNMEIGDAPQELDKLTQEEARMASTELLKITHGVHYRVQGFDGRVQEVHHKVRDIDDKLEQARSGQGQVLHIGVVRGRKLDQACAIWEHVVMRQGRDGMPT